MITFLIDSFRRRGWRATVNECQSGRPAIANIHGKVHQPIRRDQAIDHRACLVIKRAAQMHNYGPRASFGTETLVRCYLLRLGQHCSL